MPLDVGELVARIRVDGLREFQRDQQRAESSFRSLGREADRSTSNLGRGFQDSRRDVNQLTDQVGRSQTSIRQDLQRTEQAGRQSARGLGDAFRTSLDGVGDGMRSELQSVVSEAGSAGGDSGGGFMAAFGGRVAALGSKAGPVAAALIGVAAIGVVAGKSLADAVEQGFELQKGRDFSAAKFGLNPAQMEQAGKAAGDAYGNAWGDSVQDNINTAGVAIQAGLLDGNATSAEMQPLIEKLSMVSSLMGTEIPETARAAGQMIKTGLVKDGAEAFDLLTVGQQKGLNLSDDLLDTINEYGTQWRKLGIDGKTALGTIQQMTKAGARDTDIAADALKELSIRVVDGSESTAEAYKALNISQDDATNAFAKGGESALGMSRTVILALSNMDQKTRNTVGLKLFGTQWEDLGGAINGLDLSNAAAQLGQVDGAADRAGGTMNNAANSIDAAKNKISVAADNVKLKLGEAFAPAAMDLGNWITAHQDEIVDFFKAAADGALIFTEGMANVTAGALDMSATVMRVGANFLDYFVIPVLNGVQEVGSLMSHLPGSAGKMGEELRDGAKASREALGQTRDSLRTVADGTNKAADGARSFADHIDGARKNLMGLGDESKGSTNPAIQTTTQMVQGLTGELNKLPRNVPINVDTPGGQTALNLLQSLGIAAHKDNNKNIVVDAPMAPAVLQQLEALGVSVRTDNGKTILVTDNNTATITKDKIDAIARERRIAYIDVMERQGYNQRSVPAEQGPGLYTPPARATGGRVGGNGGPRADDQLIWASSPEWVIQSEAAEFYGDAKMNAVNNGTAHIMAYATGGQVGTKPGPAFNRDAAIASAKSFDGQPYEYGNFDCSGYLSEVWRRGTGLEGRFTTDSDFESLGWVKGDDPNGFTIGTNGGVGTQGHMSGRLYGVPIESASGGIHYGNGAKDPGTFPMVYHWPTATQAAGAQTTATGQRTIPLTQNPDGTWTSSDPAWAALIKRESGGNASIVQGIQDANSGGNEASGLFQIAKGTWASNGGTEFAATAGQADPEKQAIVAARIFDKSGGSPWGAGLAGREDEAGLRAGITSSAAPSAASTVGAGAGSGSGQPVFVTNWPSTFAETVNSTGSTTTKKATTPGPVGLGPLPIAAYMDGGTIPGTGNKDSELIWAMPGEEVIRKGPAAKHRPLLKAINADKFAGGGTVGFGGYSDDTRDYMAPTSLSDYVALGVGGAFTAASVAAPYVSMATSKQVNLGSLTPNVDTGANSVDGVAQAVGQVATDIQKQLAEIRKAIVEDGKQVRPVHVVNQPRPAVGNPGGMRMMAAGVG